VRRTFGPGSGTIGVGSARATIPTARLRITANVDKVQIGIPHREHLQVSAGGQSATVTREEVEPVCETPCDLIVRPGTYELVADHDERVGAWEEIEIAAGDDLAYDVRLGRPAAQLGVLALGTVGSVAAISGGIMMALQLSPKESRQAMAATLAGGAAVAVTIPLAIVSYSKFKKVPTPPPAPAAPAPTP
jgi:hypothetical protein